MSIYASITGLSSLSCFLTGLFIYTRNPHHPLYQRCFIFTTSVALWALGYYVTLLGIENYSLNIFSSRLSHAFGALIPITYLHFVWVLLKNKSKKKFFLWAYVLSFSMFLLSLTPLVVHDVVQKMHMKYYPDWGILYPLYASLFVVFPGYAQIELAREIWRAHGGERTRLVYFFVVLALAFSGGISLFLLIFNIQFPPYFSTFILLFPPMMAYTILVHKFMDIQVIIRKTVVFTGLSSFVLGIFALMTFLVRNVLDAYTSMGNTVTNLISIALVVLCYDRLREFLVNITDKYLFQKKINYRVLLREASEYLAHVDSLQAQARTIVAFLLKKARIANAAVYAFISSERSALLLKSSRPVIRDKKFDRIHLSHPLVHYFSHHRGPIEINALRELRNSRDVKTVLEPEKLDEILNAMTALNAEAVIPCFGGDRIARLEKQDFYLKALLFLGPQKSDEPYSEEDMDVFFTLAQESSIAFENARLYDEAIERSRELALINKELENMNEKLRVTQASLIVAEKNATMVGMAKAIGHEINNPLSGVIMPVERIHKIQLPRCRGELGKIKEIIPKEYHERIEEHWEKVQTSLTDIEKGALGADRSSNRISAVVHTLTDILRDTKGEMRPLSLIVLCQEAVEASRFSTYDENLTGCNIKTSIQANVLIRGNINQLLQVFVNLIKNAFEAMDKQKNREILITGDFDPSNNAMARIEFSDNGPGIPPSVLPKIWTQGFSTKQRKDDGLGAAGQGQGLFICKHMIESLHKGTMTVENAIGKGTKFIIQLPLAEPRGNA